MRHQPRQRPQPTPDTSSLVALRTCRPHAVRTADGSVRAALECPSLPVISTGSDRAWLTLMNGLLDQLDHQFQLVVQRRSGRLDPGGTTSRLRDAYERLLAERWPDRPVRHRRLFVVVSSAADGDEHVQAERLERQVGVAAELLRGSGIETVRVPADALAAFATASDFEELRREAWCRGRLARTLSFAECPSLMSSDWLTVLEATDADLDVSAHIRAPAPGTGPGRAAPAELHVTVWAADRPAMDEASRALEHALAERLARTRRAVFEAEPAFVATLPLALPQAGAWRSVQVRTLASLLSAAWSGDAARDRGLLCGVEPGSGRPLPLDRAALADRAAIVLGAENAGQSSVLMVEAARARMAGAEVVAIDTCGEIATFVATLGGTVIRIDPQTAAPFDAFAVHTGRPGALSARIACLTAVIELLAGGLTDHRALALEHALSYAFALGGHTDDGEASRPGVPIVSEVVAALKRQAARAFGEIKSQIEALAHVVTVHASGLFSSDRTAPPSRVPLTAYDLSGMPAGDRPATALLTLDHACASGSGTRPLVVLVDEISALARQPRAAAFLANLAGAAGTSGAGLRLATSDVAGFLRSRARSLVTERHLAILLRQEPDDLSALAEHLRLTPAEQAWLLATRPAEGLLVTPEQRLAFELVMTEEERRLITEGAKR